MELAAHIVSMSETSLRELGVKWRLCGSRKPARLRQITTLSSDVSVNDASTRAGFNIGKINGRLLELELSALERKQQVEIIASPRLLASHMQPASIKQGKRDPLSGFQWRKRRHFGGVQRGGAGHGGHADGAAAGKSAA